MASVKINAMRILDRASIEYEAHFYENGGSAVDGALVAQKLEIPVEKVLKTLVAQGAHRQN